MTKEQIKFLRESFYKKDSKGNTATNSIYYVHDNTVVFRDHNDFIIFDDDHELIYCIAANANLPIKNECPFSINATGYEMLQFVEANLTFDGLMALLKNMFSTLMKPEQIAYIENWAKNLPATTKGVEPNIGDYWMDKDIMIPRSTVNSSWVREIKKEEDGDSDESDNPETPENPNPENPNPENPNPDNPNPDNPNPGEPSVGEGEIIPDSEDW